MKNSLSWDGKISLRGELSVFGRATFLGGRILGEFPYSSLPSIGWEIWSFEGHAF